MSSTKRRSKAATRGTRRAPARPTTRRRSGMTFACVVITATAGAAFAAGPVMAFLRNGGSVAVSANP